MMKKIGLYIHIPFCRSKCFYCDFNSFPGKEHLIPSYFEALKEEIGQYGRSLENCHIGSVFIGGGTPSLVEARWIYELMNVCYHRFNMNEGAEVSIEANPGTLAYEKLMLYKAMGINRLSIGLQAWQDRLLKSLGRIHTIDEFVGNYKLARKAGFRNINVDLIFGLPGQTLNDWTRTVLNTIKLEPEHISCYSLKIEDGTEFAKRLETGELAPADDELDRRMYYFAVERLEECGYRHYEISNFAKPGYVCRHNIIYWKAEEYLGVGAGAHSYLNGRRFNNICRVEDYISAVLYGQFSPIENEQLIDKGEEMSEFMMLGFRLTDGVSEDEFNDRFGCDAFSIFGRQLEKLLKKQLIEVGGGRIKLSVLGLDMANQVFMEFV